jgi:hypothetical protein
MNHCVYSKVTTIKLDSPYSLEVLKNTGGVGQVYITTNMEIIIINVKIIYIVIYIIRKLPESIKQF